jgi:hypothetical protein
VTLKPSRGPPRAPAAPNPERLFSIQLRRRSSRNPDKSRGDLHTGFTAGDLRLDYSACTSRRLRSAAQRGSPDHCFRSVTCVTAPMWPPMHPLTLARRLFGKCGCWGCGRSRRSSRRTSAVSGLMRLSRGGVGMAGGDQGRSGVEGARS